MKKLLAGLLTTALVLTLSAPNALAAPRHHSWAAQRIANGIQAGCIRPACAFVDADGDGTCDNYDPENCPGNGQGNGGNGAGFVDTDGDGVCDNYNPTVCPGNGQGWNGGGQGWGRGHRGGRHCR